MTFSGFGGTGAARGLLSPFARNDGARVHRFAGTLLGIDPAWVAVTIMCEQEEDPATVARRCVVPNEPDPVRRSFVASLRTEQLAHVVQAVDGLQPHDFADFVCLAQNGASSPTPSDR